MTSGLIKRVRISPPDSHVDGRRAIIDIYRADLQKDFVRNIAAIGSIMVRNPDKGIDEGGRAILGNHYHQRKDELFHLSAGRGVLHLLDVESGEDLVLQLEASDPRSTYLFVPRKIVHTYCLEPGSVLIHAAANIDSQLYNPTDAADNIAHILVKPSR